jgi:SAM-dependent methyltransferase
MSLEWRERIGPEDLGSWVVGAEHLARYLFACHFSAGKRVVDLCCGSGYGANLLQAAGAESVVGVDVDPGTVASAGDRYPQVRFAVADVTEKLNLDADLYVCFEGLEHVHDPDGLLANMEGGMAIISTPNGAVPSANPYHIREYTLEELKEMLARHFDSVRVYFQWREGDPFDTAWNWRTFAKAFVPAAIKSRLQRPSVPSEGSSPNHVSAFPYRPLPASYPLPPGMRYGPPPYWIAVCR